MSAEITNVIADSPAWHHGVKAGDILVSVNGHKISDVLDYMYYSSESMVTLALKRGDKHIILKFPKNEYDDLGLEFETFLMSSAAAATSVSSALSTRCPRICARPFISRTMTLDFPFCRETMSPLQILCRRISTELLR